MRDWLRGMGRWGVWAGSLLILALPGQGFVGEINAAGQVRRWMLNPPDTRVPTTAVNRTSRAILYRLDDAAYSATNRAAEWNAVRVAFDQWQAVAGTVLKFEEGPMASGTRDVNSQDGLNTVFWTTNLLVNGGRDNLSGVLALTYVASFSNGNVITDADLVFNGVQYRWFTNPEDPTVSAPFVEAIALHEVGHFLGLRHSPVGGATMLYVGDLGVNSQVGLAWDEQTAARALYGTAATGGAVGSVRGIVRLAGNPVFGAAVFAEDHLGRVMAGTVTRTNGAYELPGLEAGLVMVRSAPLDPAFAANYLIRGSDIASAYGSARTDFHPTAPRAVTVSAGATEGVDLEVTAGDPLRVVRLLRPAADLVSPSYNNKPVTVPSDGRTVYLGVLTASPLVGSVELAIPGAGLVVGPTEVRPNALGSLSLVAARVTIGADAAAGLRSFRLKVGDRVGWASGFLEVQEDIPDANFDGFDDRFQRRYWPRFTAAEAGPEADPDGDGFRNRWEYETGSDPTDRGSAHFSIESVRVTATGAVVRSQTAAGRRFQLYTRETVPGTDWQAVGAPVTAAGGVTEFNDPGATRQIRYYRVQMLP